MYVGYRYEDGSDLAYFDGLSDTILSVALLRPKKDIFQSHIKYLLCLTTAVEIILLGVGFGGGEDGEMHLLPGKRSSLEMHDSVVQFFSSTDYMIYISFPGRFLKMIGKRTPEPLFSLPPDATYMMAIRGTAAGRIFMGGKDGCLYEFSYRADDGWFGKKANKINHSTSKYVH